MRKASITIFATLSMILVAGALLSLLEGARYFELQRLAKLQTETALESVFAGFNRSLWESYHVLGVKDAQVEEELKEYANARRRRNSSKLNLFQTTVKDVHITRSTRLTDEKGAVFIQAVSGYMEKEFAYELLKSIYNQYESIKGLAASSELDLSKIEEALLGIETAQKENAQKRNIRSGASNALAVVNSLQGFDVLDLMVQDKSLLSTSQIQLENVVSHRVIKEGWNTDSVSNGWTNILLFHQYLHSYFSSYETPKENTVLTYELEYLLGGRQSDVQNLTGVVKELLFVRELCNFLYLTSDVQKKEEARVLALALVGLSANPVLIETVRLGILTAWAFCESILDVRGLLNGRKIALLKNVDTWTTTLSELGNIGWNYVMAKDCSGGLDYEQYLAILLFFQDEHTLAMRAMDLQELVIQEKMNQRDFRMDTLFTQMEVEIGYQYRPVFYIFDQIEFPLKPQIDTKATYSYN